MKKLHKTSVMSLAFLGVLLFSFLGSASGIKVSDINISQIQPPFIPGDLAINDFILRAPGFADKFVKANISGTNVYYLTVNASGPRSASINHADNGMFQYNVSDIKAFFSEWYENVESLNASLHAWNETLDSFVYGTSSDTWSIGSPVERAWKEQIAKEWYAIKADYNGSFAGNVTFAQFVGRIEAEFSATKPLPGAAPALFAGRSWANATPEEVIMVLNTEMHPVHALWVMQFMYRDQNGIPDLLDTTITEIVEYTLDVLTPAKNELDVPGRETLSITYDMFVDLDISIDAEDVGVVVIWDNDDSLAEFIADLKAHRIPRSQPFTGDEIMYMVHFNRIVTTISGDIVNDVSWEYNDNSEPTEFMNALRIITRKPFAAQFIAAAASVPVNLFRMMLYGNVNITGGSRTFTDSSFSMAQLKVNQLRFSLIAGGGIEPDTVDLWYAEHKMVGLFAYDDLNQNGIQDIAVRGTVPFLYPVSNESRYRYRMHEVDAINYIAPHVVENELKFGINFTGIEGEFVPYDLSEDIVNLNASVDGSLPENVTNIGFMFKFGVNKSNSEGRMKLNYELGDFTSNNSVDPALANMSLSMITVFSGFRLMHGSRTITNTNVVDQGGTGIDVNANETRYVRRVRFASGTSLASRVFEMDLDSIPYESGGTSYTAFGQLIPVKMGSITWGRMTTAGNITTQTGTAMYGVVMLYAVNFPTWNGNAIIHDPVFSTFIPSTDGGKNLWVVIVIAVAGIAAVVIIIGVVKAKKRDSSYPGYHVDTRREVKSRPRHAPEHLSVDFLHSFLILFGNNAAGLDGSEPMIDKYDPDMFCFFSGIIHEIIGGLRVKDGAWKKISSKKQDDDVTVPETVLDPRIFISSEKIPETVGTGKVYVYSMKSHNSQGIWMLDALLFVNPEWIARLSLYSTGVLDEMTARRLLPSIRALAKAISEHQEGKNEGEIQRLVERYLPTSLARPRDIVLPAVSTFLNHVRTDNGFAGDDVDAIENDLEMLSMEQADSIISAFASRVREQQEQDKEGINKTRET